MTPATGTAILVLVVFVLPGFVALRYAEQTYRTRADDTQLDRLLSALYFSALSYVVVAAGALLLFHIKTRDVHELWRGHKPFGVYVALAATAIAVPLAIAEIARRWSGARIRVWVLREMRISPAHKTPSGWEHFFLRGRWAYVRATLKDGRVVAGFYGPDSFAGYTAETPDLYLEERLQLDHDDWFDGKAAGTLGVYVRADDIVSVEFYDAGGPQPKLSRWRRLVARIRGDAAANATATDSNAADSKAGRDLAGGSTAAESPAPSAGSE